MAKLKKIDESVLRQPAEIQYKEELESLKKVDRFKKPDSWFLSPPAVLLYILGGKTENGVIISPKYIGDRKLVEMCIATLLTDRALLLMGMPGTAKSWFSEHLSAAISGRSTLIVQGTLGTDDHALRYSWNYAELLQKGPSRAALVSSPVLNAMEQGAICRIEELTRMPTEIQDMLITILSEKIMPIPELQTEIYAKRGFNIIGTANDRDRGVNDLSAALRRRFNIVYMPLPKSIEDEMAIISFRMDKIQSISNLQKYTIPLPTIKDVVKMFRELRNGITEDQMSKVKSPSSALSTAEILYILETSLHHAINFGNGKVSLETIFPSLYYTIVKGNAVDEQIWNEYVESILRKRKEWVKWYEVAKSFQNDLH